MTIDSHSPLDTGQRDRQERRTRYVRMRVRRVLLSRRVLMTVLWVAKAIVHLARLVSQVFDSS